MLIDCDVCVARGPACGDCVVTVLLRATPSPRPGAARAGIDLDTGEQEAIAVLAGSGLVPPLRLVTDGPGDEGAGVPAGPAGPFAGPGDGRAAAV